MNSYFKSILVVSVALSGCAGDGRGLSNRPFTNLESGALIGAVGGAVVGAVAYHQNRTKGALIGAVGGGLAGGAVGAYMDSQKRDLEKNLSQEIQSGEAQAASPWSGIGSAKRSMTEPPRAQRRPARRIAGFGRNGEIEADKGGCAEESVCGRAVERRWRPGRARAGRARRVTRLRRRGSAGGSHRLLGRSSGFP